MKIFLSLLLCMSCLAARSADLITATIIVATNAPLGNTNSLTINGNVRTFTNTVTGSPGTLIQQTNSFAWTATNILNQLTDYRVSQFHYLGQSSPTNVTIRGAVGEALTVTLAGGWGRVSYSTQTVATPTAIVRVPMSVEYASNRAWIASALIDALNDWATNTFDTNATAMGNFLTKGASALQSITAPVQFNALIGSALSSLTNANLFNSTNRGYVVALTNGIWTNATLVSPKFTNGVNYGNAFSSPGLGTDAEQLGAGAYTGGDYGTSIGAGAGGTNTSATSVGRQAFAGETGTAIGSLAVANTNSAAGGYGARAAGYGNAVWGTGADDNGFFNVSLFGNYADADRDNLTQIGSSTQYTRIRGNTQLEQGATNFIARGTNTIDGRLDAPARVNTTLANGYNSGVIFGTNLVVEFSGPSGAYTNAGFAAPGGPQIVWAQFDNPGLSFTILNESGLDAVAANRVITDTGGLLNSTNRTVFVGFRYDTGNSRWRILSFR